MKTFYFERKEPSRQKRLEWAGWLDENAGEGKWEWSFAGGFGRDPTVGITIHEEEDCVAFALRFKCYKISWNGLNVLADEPLTTE